MDLKKLKYKKWTKKEVDKWLEDNWVEDFDNDELFNVIKGFPEVALEMETENNKEGELIIVIRGQKY